jgi:hypothetical protein
MGKKKPPRRWTVHLKSGYRPSRDDRIIRAYELALPIIISTSKIEKNAEEENNNEIVASHRHLRARLQ